MIASTKIRKLELGQSILDTVADQARELQSKLGKSDRNRIDQYFTSVRDLEKRMTASKEWETSPQAESLRGRAARPGGSQSLHGMSEYRSREVRLLHRNHAQDQFLSMAFAQMTFRESLRDIEACLSGCRHLYAMGFRGNVTRTNLAYANQRRDWRI